MRLSERLWVQAVMLVALTPGAGWAQSVVSGVVTDVGGALLPGARVRLTCAGDAPVETVADGLGEFRLQCNRTEWTLDVTADSLAPRRVVHTASMDERTGQVVVHLLPLTVNTDVTVTAKDSDVAQAQLQLEEKQRVLGLVPNFYVSYFPNAVPLTASHKMSLAWRSSLDPMAFVGVGFQAGMEQWQNSFGGYGQGAKGYGKRFGAAFADNAISTLLGGAVLPIVFKQDPRYFYEGVGPVHTRLGHALSYFAVARGDNGRLQPNYSNLLGTLASAGISNAYYPPADRGAKLVFLNSASGFAFQAFSAVMEEFVVKKLTPHLPHRRHLASRPIVTRTP